METQIQWDLDADETATTAAYMRLSVRQFLDIEEGTELRVVENWAQLTNHLLGALAIRLISEAHRLTALAAAAKVIAGGFAPENFTLSTVMETVQPKVGNREEIFPVAEEMGTLAYHQLAEACAIDLLRSARAGRHLLTGMGPFGGYDLPESRQLSGIAVPVTVLGVAALAALAYWGSEHSEDVAAVEVEKAWAAARAYSEIKVAQAELASGRKPQLSDWGQARLRTARLQTAGWFPYAAIGVGGVLVAAAAYLGRDKLSSMRSVGSSPPSRENPTRRRRRLKRRAPRSCSNPTRAEFIGEARAGGASPAQAARLWKGYLAAQRSRAGRRGGKARSRRRNPAAGRTPALRAPVGKPISRVTSSEPSSKPSAPKRAAAPKRRAPSGSPGSPKRAKRAKPSAKRPAKAARRVAKKSGKPRAKPSQKRKR